MKATLHENGWTVFLTDFDFKTATKEEIDLIGCLVATNTLVIARNQSMTVDEEVEIVQKFGDTEHAVAEPFAGMSADKIQKNKNTIERYMVPGSNGYLYKVSGEENHKGERGLFGHVHELEWHCNQVERKNRKPIVWLRSIRGSVGSKTSWTNHAVAYEKLPLALKKLCQSLTVDYTYNVLHRDNKYENDDIRNTLSTLEVHDFGRAPMSIPDYTPPLVITNEGGVTGLFFSWLQIQKLNGPGMTVESSKKFIGKLRDTILADERNLYHHEWQEGDVVISEQWLGIHKRWAFDELNKRVLHRANFNYSNIDLTKIPQAQELLKNNG